MEFYLGSCPEKNPRLIFWMEAQSSLTLPAHQDQFYNPNSYIEVMT
jgi:hypothetical protein